MMILPSLIIELWTGLTIYIKLRLHLQWGSKGILTCRLKYASEQANKCGNNLQILSAKTKIVL